MEGFWQWHGEGGPWALATLALVFALALVLLALWVALPFAVFGTKRLLRELLAEQRETNRRLAALEPAASEELAPAEPDPTRGRPPSAPARREG